MTGTSGSTLDDQLRVIQRFQAGTLAPDQVVAAVGGLLAAREAIQAVNDKRFAGKIVIYPQLVDLPLTALDDLHALAPDVHALLGPRVNWNAAAEEALLTRFLPENGQDTAA